ncbi:MAG: hypothetical protein ABI346_07650 [Candidatus Baltobacteraceae bacterium]
MTKFTTLAGIAACAASLTVSALAAGASPIRSFGPQMRNSNEAVSIARHYMPTRYNSHFVQPNTGQLNYNHGSVLLNPKQYVILWGFKAAGDPDKIGALYLGYVRHYGGSGMANILTQYYDIVSGIQHNVTNPAHNGVVWRDNSSPVPAHATDAQVMAEAWVAAAHFGGADPNGAYIVVSPYNHDPQGFLTQGWCAYHGASQQGGKTISYTNMPYLPDGGGSCGANFVAPPPGELGAAEGQTIVTGHEYAESVTDPSPPSGWYNNSFGEIGDECAWTNIQNDPFGFRKFTMQPEYSNASASCVHTYP